MDSRPQSAGLIAIIAVMNIIWWMVMIAAIGLGATHMDRCPQQPKIPVYLIVLGATSLLSLIFTYSSSGYQDGAVHILSVVCMTFLHIFSFAWLIAGSSWVYSIYPPNYSEKDQYCHKTTYQFAFVVTTLLWVAMILVILCSCCFALLTCCTTVVAGRHLLPDRKSFYGATSFHEPATGDV
ncbi:transmembrane protein 272-like [Cyprinodon tularosa]|uniref:transmembrane protein 272-like n=1 Tax=Cyprinodon tularosa TaxID=77115 RepID=UPI0018E21639|nr:transmembrane protein 272-like [Cyprinodon tularosa]